MNFPDAAHSAHILIVDDNPITIACLRKVLEHAGFQHIVGCTQSTHVCALYAQQHFDALILDMFMPGLTGLEVIAELTRAFPTDYLPILMLTSDTDPAIKLSSLSSGAQDFLLKTCDNSELLLRLYNILRASARHKKLRQTHAELEHQITLRTQQLHDSQIKLIHCLGKVGEFRDNETGMHVIRMSKIAMLLAQRLGLDDDACNMILHASPMHDLGKIAIADKVLLKPGKLDPDEWQVMQTHASIGAKILENFGTELMDVAASIAQNHHEKFDGSGYPRGLAGEAIPLYARICSVCDVFDALLSHRPYKAPWSIDETLLYLREQSGKQFDPRIIDVFFHNMDEVLAIRAAFPDISANSLQTAPLSA